MVLRTNKKGSMANATPAIPLLLPLLVVGVWRMERKVAGSNLAEDFDFFPSFLSRKCLVVFICVRSHLRRIISIDYSQRGIDQ
jgi:hypothetical protein